MLAKYYPRGVARAIFVKREFPRNSVAKQTPFVTVEGGKYNRTREDAHRPKARWSVASNNSNY